MDNKEEIKGEAFILISAIIHGFFPIFINQISQKISPVLLASLSNLIPAFFLSVYIYFIRDSFKKIFDKTLIKYFLGSVLFVVIIPSIFIFIGTQHTSSINTSILLQSELLFTILICAAFFNEKITIKKTITSLIILLGTLLVLYNGSFEAKFGDLFIIIGTSFYPFGNFCQKKILQKIDPYSLLFARSLIGGIFLLFLSLSFENLPNTTFIDIKESLFYIVSASILIFLTGKILWFKGLKYLDISKSITIISSTPAFTMCFAYFLLHEIPTIYQITGLVIIIIGLFIVTKKEKIQDI